MESKLFDIKWALTDLSDQIGNVDSNTAGNKVAACFKPNIEVVHVIGEYGNILKKLTGHRKRVTCIRFHPQTDMVASTSEDSTVRLWAPDGGPDRRISYFRKPALWLDWSKDGNFLASCGEEGSVLVCDKGGNFVCDLRNAEGALRSVKWSPDSYFLAAASDNDAVYVWNIREQNALLLKHTAPVRAIDWDSSGKTIVSVSGDGKTGLWKADGWELIDFSAPADVVFGEFSKDGQYLALGDREGNIYIYDSELRNIDTFNIGESSPTFTWKSGGELITGAPGGKLSYLAAKA